MNEAAFAGAEAALQAEERRIRDTYARRRTARLYSQLYSWFNPAYVFLAQQRERAVLGTLAANGMADLGGKRILDVGCGAGAWLHDFLKWGASPENLCGVDLLPERIAVARNVLPAAVQLRCASARTLDVPDGSFDLVVQSTVFTSILDISLKRQIAAGMVRAVRSGGFILWYDSLVDNPSNPDVRGVEQSEIRDLFPGCEIRLRRITLAPPVARLLYPKSRLLCLFLEQIPWLCTHSLGVIRPVRPL